MNSAGGTGRARGGPSAPAPRRRRCAPSPATRSAGRRAQLVALERRGAARSRARAGRIGARAHARRRTARSAPGRAPWRGTSRRRRRGAGSGVAACRRRRAMPTLAVDVLRLAAEPNGRVERARRARSAIASASCSLGDVLAEDDELVAAEARDGVARAQRPRAARSRHGQQQLVAGVVAERVVDDLEVVEVEEEHARRSARSRPARASQCVEAVEQQRAVGQPGERVVQRLVAHAPLRPRARSPRRARSRSPAGSRARRGGSSRGVARVRAQHAVAAAACRRRDADAAGDPWRRSSGVGPKRASAWRSRSTATGPREPHAKPG